MDITPKGFGKGQIAKHLRQTYPTDKIIFFGDKTFIGGNDYELAHTLSEIPNTQVVQVNAPEEVLMFLKNEQIANSNSTELNISHKKNNKLGPKI